MTRHFLYLVCSKLISKFLPFHAFLINSYKQGPRIRFPEKENDSLTKNSAQRIKKKSEIPQDFKINFQE
ncbi:hypothetical protein BpHYR1_047409 [Brachionus plicatilis]|uniref:Uncharacterized protein n=1 Tax=Brachionus plicatilis TaxID=10195 RepID=A0A3M7RAH5_BRAPC|nr:hypothetical protein BpHYR1_047409 [Brachionus plicatilis]